MINYYDMMLSYSSYRSFFAIKKRNTSLSIQRNTALAIYNI